LARRAKNKVPIVGMAGRDSVDAMKEFVDRYDLGVIPHAVDDDGSLWRNVLVRAQPAWVLIDRKGESKILFGPQSKSTLKRAFKKMAKA
jgi:hypothetical protein